MMLPPELLEIDDFDSEYRSLFYHRIKSGPLFNHVVDCYKQIIDPDWLEEHFADLAAGQAGEDFLETLFVQFGVSPKVTEILKTAICSFFVGRDGTMPFPLKFDNCVLDGIKIKNFKNIKASNIYLESCEIDTVDVFEPEVQDISMNKMKDFGTRLCKFPRRLRNLKVSGGFRGYTMFPDLVGFPEEVDGSFFVTCDKTLGCPKYVGKSFTINGFYRESEYTFAGEKYMYEPSVDYENLPLEMDSGTFYLVSDYNINRVRTKGVCAFLGGPYTESYEKIPDGIRFLSSNMEFNCPDNLKSKFLFI